MKLASSVFIFLVLDEFLFLRKSRFFSSFVLGEHESDWKFPKVWTFGWRGIEFSQGPHVFAPGTQSCSATTVAFLPLKPWLLKPDYFLTAAWATETNCTASLHLSFVVLEMTASLVLISLFRQISCPGFVFTTHLPDK